MKTLLNHFKFWNNSVKMQDIVLQKVAKQRINCVQLSHYFWKRSPNLVWAETDVIRAVKSMKWFYPPFPVFLVSILNFSLVYTLFINLHKMPKISHDPCANFATIWSTIALLNICYKLSKKHDTKSFMWPPIFIWSWTSIYCVPGLTD